MWWQQQQSGADVGELSPERMAACCLVGDNWVTMALAHVDAMGFVYPVRSDVEFFFRRRREQPATEAVVQAVRECYSRLGPLFPGDYAAFVLCPPPWAGRSREATSRAVISTEYDPWLNRPKVEQRHVEGLEDRICVQNVSASYVVSDLIPHAFLTDQGAATADPLGATTRSLTLRAHLVMTDLTWMRAVLDGLRGAGLQVDTLLSVASAAAPQLTRSERESGATLLDIDRLGLYAACFHGGGPVHTLQVPRGSYDVVRGAAARLRMSARELGRWLNGREALFRFAGSQPAERVFESCADRSGARILEKLDEAAREPATRLADAWLHAARSLEGDARHCLQRLVCVGDDPYTLRALALALRERGIARSDWRWPGKVHANRRPPVPGYPRLVGLLRAAAGPSRRQPFLESYNATLIDVLNQHCRALPRALAQRAARALAERRDRDPAKALPATLRCVLF